MKKLLNIIAFVFAVQLVHAQSVIDSTTLKIAPSRDGLFYQIPDPGVPADNITIFEMGDKFYKLLGLSEKNTDKLGIYTNGNNYRARLQGLIDSSYITQIEVAAHFPGAITLNGDSVDFRGKKLVFKGGVNFKGTTKIKNVLIEANKRDFILDTSIVLGENVRFTSGEISVMNFGAGPTRTSIQNMAIITKLNDYAGVYKGQTILFPEGEYMVRRRGTKMIPGKSYTTYKGEGMYKTKLTLDTADYYNFRRIFDLNDGDSSITIKDMGFNMNLKGIYYDSVQVDFEGDPGEPAGDYQCLPIFTYSSDSSKAVFDVNIENIYAENIPGDVVGISRNTNNVHIKHIRFRNYIRQGISLGGGGVRDVWIEDVYDLGSTTVLQVGGHSIHCEPSSIQWNINYLNSTVRDFSYSGVGSGSIIGITTTSNNDLLCNLVSNTEIFDNTLNGRLQVSANSRGNIKINNNRELNAGVTFTTVSGASGTPAPSFITGNKKIIGINAPAIQLLNVDSITVSDNNVQNTGDATISAGNCRSTIITRNRVKKNGTGNYPGIYTYSTTTANYGAGMDYIDGNIVESSYRGIVVGNKSAIIGPANVVTAPTPYELSTAKIFPYRGPDGRQILSYKTSGLPNYNDWVKGDVIIVNTTTAGEPTKYICDTTGALYLENWRASATYYRYVYVRDSTNGRIYRSRASNGQNELPSSDTDTTYWIQVATRAAVFSAVEWYRDKIKGYGVPTLTNNIAYLTEYYRLDGDTCTSKYIYYTGIGWKATGCGAGGGLSEGQAVDLINQALDTIKGSDTLKITQGFSSDSLKTRYINKPGDTTTITTYIPTTDSSKVVEIINNQPEYVIQNGTGVELLNNVTGSPSKRIKGLQESLGIDLIDDTAAVTPKLNFIVRNFASARQIATLDTTLTYQIGQRRFYYDPSDNTSADDSAMTIVTTGGGRLKRLIDRAIYAEDFGAIGNGTTDDSKAFNKMFRWIEGSRKKMYEIALKPTTYLLQDTIFLPKVITGVNSMATLRITGNGTLLKKTSTGVMLWRVPKDITEAQDYIGSYKLILDGVDFLGDNTGQKAIVASSFYTAQLKNCTFTTFDTAVILPFWLNGIIEGNVFTNCKTQAFIGCSLSGFMASGNTSNSAFNANYFHKNRVVNRVNSFSAFMFLASDGCVIDDNISEGQNPRYDMYIDCQAATVANGIVIKNTWFESTGSGINTCFFLRQPNIVIDGFQNDYADTLFNSGSAIVNQRVHISNIHYIPAGTIFNGGSTFNNSTSMIVEGALDTYLDYFIDTTYWVNHLITTSIKVRKLAEVKTNSAEIIRPNIYTPASTRQYRVEANVISTDNTYYIGAFGGASFRPRGIYAGTGGFVAERGSGSIGFSFGDPASRAQGLQSINDSVLNLYSTGAVRIPAGTTTQRPAHFARGFRYNTTLSQFEGNNGSSWKRLLFSPYTTSGDIMYWDGTVEARLALGAANTILGVKSDGTGLEYKTLTSSQWTTSGNNIYYNTGFVGVNKTTPTQRLHVGGQLRIDTLSSGVAGTDSIIVVKDGILKKIAANYYLSTATTDTTIISTKANVDHQIRTAVDADVFTPSRGNPTNVASSTVESFMYQRVKNIVHYKGRLKVTASGAGATSIDLALPIAATFSAITDLSGSGTLNGVTFDIQAAPTLLNVARISFTATGAVEHLILIDCMYELP